MTSDENPVSVRPFGFRSPRISTNFSFFVEVAATGERYEAVCTDISEDGLAADLLQPLAPKTTVTIRMLLPGGTAPLHIPGSVEYSLDGRCGLNFLYSSSEDRRQVQLFIQSIA
ncbi:MAG: PilZ domain-containing protein [Terriglobales bacterium]